MFFKKKRRSHSNDAEDALRVLNPETPFAIKEAFKALNTNILYLPIESSCKKICVTSSYVGEGKTYLSVNLALTLADNADNKKVLLIDMDMRKPRVARLLKDHYDKGDVKTGISEYLAGISKEPDFVKTKNDNLFLLLSGAGSVNPAGLISSSKMSTLMQVISEKFDYVIIDSPPVGIVTDALLLASNIDGYLLAARADYSDIRSLSNTVERIEKLQSQLFGVVLTSVNPKENKLNYGYKYKDYSKYDSQA